MKKVLDVISSAVQKVCGFVLRMIIEHYFILDNRCVTYTD